MSLSATLSAEPLSFVRQCLHDATRFWHERLEATDFAQAPLSRNLSLAGYAAHLGHCFSVIAPLEERIARCLTCAEAEVVEQGAWQFAPRHVDLARDLASLREVGAHVPIPEYAPWHPARLPCAAWEALGAAYVLEAARLSGLVVARHLRRQLGREVPLAYYGGDLAPWRAFLSVLELDEAKQNVERIVAGAVNAFCGLHECVTGTSHAEAV